MSVYVNGHLLYGFVCSDDTDELFEVIQGENEEDLPFEELHQELQEKHAISLREVGCANVGIVAAFSTNVSGKSFDVAAIAPEALAKTSFYDANITAFLQDLDIDPASYKPGWHLLTYMD